MFKVNDRVRVIDKHVIAMLGNRVADDIFTVSDVDSKTDVITAKNDNSGTTIIGSSDSFEYISDNSEKVLLTVTLKDGIISAATPEIKFSQAVSDSCCLEEAIYDVVYGALNGHNKTENTKPMMEGKYICVDKVIEDNFVTVGKIYEFKGGQTTWDNDNTSLIYESLDDFHEKNYSEPYRKSTITLLKLKE